MKRKRQEDVPYSWVQNTGHEYIVVAKGFGQVMDGIQSRKEAGMISFAIGALVAYHEESMSLRSLVSKSHRIAREHGWWEGERNIGELLCLIHSEISEALEEWRNGHPCHSVRIGPKGKPEGFPTELADVVIRVADLCGKLGIDLNRVILQKMAFNEKRPYRHGGKKA